MADVTVADRDLSKLHPMLQRRLLDFFQELGRRKLAAYVTEGFRPLARQAYLYASGRERPGPVLTYAKPGQSYHNLMINGRPCSAAVDFAIWDEDVPWSKSLEWNGSEREWQLFAEAAAAVGLETLHFERPHVQLPYDLDELRQGRHWPADLLLPPEVEITTRPASHSARQGG